MQPQRKLHISIIGAGLTGAFLAVLLAKRGYKVTVYERMSKSETLKSSQRSINISFHNYTQKAFQQAGVWSEIKKDILPLQGSITKLPHYAPIYASFANLQLDYFSARREKILRALVTKAQEYPNLTFVFQTALLHVHRTEKTLLIQNTKTKKIKTVTTDLVVGADGVHSTVRAFLQQGQHSQHNQNQVGWEYKQIFFPEERIHEMPMAFDRAYSSTRKYGIFVALPNKDRTFNGMLALPRENGFSRLTTDAKVTGYIKEHFPELAPGLPEIVTALKKNPNGNFITMKTFPWVYKDFMAIVGDAGHSVTPFIGHGVTVGLGDATNLVACLTKYENNIGRALAEYQEIRKKNADVLVDMSLESFSNFQRERKANYRIIYMAFESVLHRLFPAVFASSTFERIVHDPDHAAAYRETHRKQRRLLRFLGAPIAVAFVTGLILSLEIISHALNVSKMTVRNFLSSKILFKLTKKKYAMDYLS